MRVLFLFPFLSFFLPSSFFLFLFPGILAPLLYKKGPAKYDWWLPKVNLLITNDYASMGNDDLKLIFWLRMITLSMRNDYLKLIFWLEMITQSIRKDYLKLIFWLQLITLIIVIKRHCKSNHNSNGDYSSFKL